MAEYIRKDTLTKVYMMKGKDKLRLSTVINELEMLPAADVAPVRHGKWIDNGVPDSILCGCSLCNFPCGAYTFQFCPKCGAKMDLEDEA